MFSNGSVSNIAVRDHNEGSADLVLRKVERGLPF